MRIFKATTLLLTLLLVTAAGANATTARLQVIHNAADAAAASVDIYVNGSLFEDEFAFRTATPFQDVPAGVELNIGVAPGGPSTPADIIANFPVTLEEGKTYVAIANGVLDPSMYAPNPDGNSTAFTIFAKDGIREQARWSKSVDIIGFHGATDAPEVDILIRRTLFNRLINNLEYGEFSHYRRLSAKSYILDVTPAYDNSTVVASFEADLSGLKGGAAVVFASGFLSPADNNMGAPFGLFAALPNGVVVELPAITPTASLQLIHNAADPGAAVVDIYVNGGLFKDNFEFRTATPSLDVPAGVNLNVGVAPGNSTSASDVIADFDFVLEDGNRYVAIANGVLDPGSFEANPEGLNIGFNVYAKDKIRSKAPFPGLVNLVVFHGATDAPEIDVIAKGSWWKWIFVNDLSYGEFTDYKYLLPREYTLSITPSGDNSTVVASYLANLSGLSGGAAIVFASGFLNPAANQNGAPFGLFVALGDGTVIQLPTLGSASAALAKITDAPVVPREFKLNQNFPNPFNPTTTISFSLPADSRVSLKVFNVLGQEVRNVLDDMLPAGEHEVTIDAGGMASGMYFYRLTTDAYSDTKKMMLLK